jgi:hypothetical protein
MHPLFLITTEEVHNPSLAQSSIDSPKRYFAENAPANAFKN